MKYFAMIGAAAAALIAASGSSFASGKMVVNLCTGSEGRPYHLTGEYIKQFVRDSKAMELRVINTKGTWDNIERTTTVSMNDATVASGEACHAFIGQPDGAVILKRKNPAAASKLRIVGQGPREFLHVLCNKDSGVDDLSDLSGDNSKSVALGATGSGSWLIWQNFVSEDASYGEVQTTAEEGAIALASVASGDTTCVLVPAALGNATVAQADTDFGDSLALVGANDWDFNDAKNIDGKPLYTWQKIPSGTYPENLQGWFSGKETVAWMANIYVNTEYFSGNQKALEELIVASAKARPAIKKTFGVLE
jgi:TRAP-type uncharacterized transport system substrate-binding protein